MFLQRFNLCQASSLFLSREKGHELFVSLQAHIRVTFSGTSSYSSEMISLRHFTGAIVCHKLVCTPRAWGISSPVTHILTPWKILIGLPGTSCEPIYLAGSHKYQTALCFPVLQCPGNFCFWNFLWMLTASIMHQQQRHVAPRVQSCQMQIISHRIISS